MTEKSYLDYGREFFLENFLAKVVEFFLEIFLEKFFEKIILESRGNVDFEDFGQGFFGNGVVARFKIFAEMTYCTVKSPERLLFVR